MNYSIEIARILTKSAIMIGLVFIPQSLNGQDVKIVFAADWQAGLTSVTQDTTEARKVVNYVNNRGDIDCVVSLGDMANVGEGANLQMNSIASVLDDLDPVHLALAGNHDTYNPLDTYVGIDTFKHYFPIPEAAVGSDSVWAYDHGNGWAGIFVNTGALQGQTFDYAHVDSISKYVHIFSEDNVYIATHRGIWTDLGRSGGIQGGGDVVQDIEAVMDSLYTAGVWPNVAFVINGHRHQLFIQQISNDGNTRTLNTFVLGRVTQITHIRRAAIFTLPENGNGFKGFQIDWILTSDLN